MSSPPHDEPSEPAADAPPAPDAPPASAPRRRRARERAHRALLIAALVLGTLVDGFFALVNFYPVAPRRSRGAQRFVVMSLSRAQAAWFQRTMLDEFNDTHETNLQLRVVPEDELARALAAPDVALGVVPLAQAMALADRGALAPFDSVATAAEITRDTEPLRPEVVRSARYRDRQYFLPRDVLLDVTVYRISRVRDAMLHWHVIAPEINAALRAVNGRGLPAGYALEQTPSDWDSYDAFVLAYYWAHRRYDERPARPRVAHRTGLSTEGRLDLVGDAYGAGATNETIARRDSQPVLDWFEWEALYRAEGLYAEAMFAPGGLDDEGVQDGFIRGEIYLTTVDQMEAWTLHGGGHRGAAPGVANEDDLGFVANPLFASLALDPRGRPARTTRKSFSFREEAVWVLPAQGAARATAYRFIRWALSAENHARECEALGTMPIRTDTVRDRVSLFRSPWMLDAFEAALAQWARSQEPLATITSGLGSDYALAWDQLIAQRAVSPGMSRAALADALRAPLDPTRGIVGAPARAPVAGGDAGADDADAGADDELDEAARAFAVPPLRDPVVIERHGEAGVANESTDDADASASADGQAGGGRDAGAAAPAVRGGAR
jgi:hypothetical protein